MNLPPDIETCHDVIRNFISIVEHLTKRLDEQSSRIAVLEAQLNQNSRNSSRPPSSDGLKRQPGLPKESKGQGGQVAHPGKTLEKTDKPDHIIRLTTVECLCGQLLDPQYGRIVTTRQVHDLPPPKLEVTEYQIIEQVCSCGRLHQGHFPVDVKAPVQYGSGVRALTVLLNNSCQMSYCKVSTLFKDLYGYDLNEATAVSNNTLTYERLEPVENHIKACLLASAVVHSDETGLQVGGGKPKWLHTACNTLFTYLFVSEKRGSKAHTAAVSILPFFTGWAIHDSYGFYFGYHNARHGLCGSHILRELQGQIEQGKLWAIGIRTLLLDLYTRSEKGLKTVPDIALEKDKWRKLCQEAINFEELLLPIIPPTQTGDKVKRGRKTRGKALALLDRLLKHTDLVLAFAEFEVVPFTNNQAERDIRPAKTKQKVAGCFRTMNGAYAYARIQGFISTCRKHKINVFNELRKICSPSFYDAPFGAK